MRRIAVLIAVVALGCATTPRSAELAALKLTAAAQSLANDELGRRCPTDRVAADPDLAAQCVVLSDRNVAAQQAIVTAMDAYDAAMASGDPGAVQTALDSLRGAACYVMVLFPGATTTNEALMACSRYTR